MNRHIQERTVSTWPEIDVWEQPDMGWGYFKDQRIILVFVDAGSG